MRRILVLFVFLLFAGKIFSQDLVGEWKGSFTNERYAYYGGGNTIIKLYFSKINDSTFKAFSVTYTDDKKNKDSAICILTGGFSEKNILYLEETQAVKPYSGEDSVTCFQLMKLSYYKRKKQLVLKGDWGSKINDCGYGSISLIKKL
ncbi:hypothetical protein [Ferruginibacter profundus]